MFNIKMKDDLGEHLLQNDRDCSFVCPSCGKEIKVREKHIKDGKLENPICPKCNVKMRFDYWIDCLYDEDKYNELLKKAEAGK